MKLEKQHKYFIAKSYAITLIIFNFFNYLIFLILNQNKDFELFSFNLFGSFIFYTFSFCVFYIFSLFLNLRNLNLFSKFIFLFILVEFCSLFFAQKSITVSIFTNMINQRNYILLFYPLSLIFSLIVVNYLIPLISKSDNKDL